MTRASPSPKLNLSKASSRFHLTGAPQQRQLFTGISIAFIDVGRELGHLSDALGVGHFKRPMADAVAERVEVGQVVLGALVANISHQISDCRRLVIGVS